MHNRAPDNLTAPGQSSSTAPTRFKTSRPPLYVGSEVFRRAAFGNNHPLKIVRHSAVLDMILMLDWLPSESFVEARPASVDVLREFHDPEYIEALQYAESAGRVSPEVRERYRIGTLENPLFPGLFERAATTVGGSIRAAELALDGHVIFHPSGGTHHGRPDRASGFCYFNDPVFAILTFLKRGLDKVLYVDLDAHHGDGVEDAFLGDPRVLTVSIHEEDRWPYTGRAGATGTAVNLPVPRAANDSELGHLVNNVVVPVAATFSPGAIVVCCGADCLAGDPLSSMEFSNLALWRSIDSLLELGQPTVLLGGGGYNPWTVTRYWAGLWGHINGRQMPDPLPEPAIRYLRELECDLVDDEDIDDAWLKRMADTPYLGPVRDVVKSLAERIMTEWQGRQA
jgi:acetoin utilization protein AcuC